MVEACRRANVARTTVYRHRDEDAEFAAAWAEVDEVLVERMEREAYRRAVEGVHRDIFHQGTVVGEERVYSDTLLIFMLKAKRPATYRDNVKVEHTGDGGGPVQLDVLDGRQPAELSPAKRRKLAKILADDD